MCASTILATLLAVGCGASGSQPGQGIEGTHSYDTYVDGAIAAGHTEIVVDADYQDLRYWSWRPGGGATATWLRMDGAEAHRNDGPMYCGASDARLIYDPQVDRYFDFSTGTTAIQGYAGYCIGVGRGTNNDPWVWNHIYWSDQLQDGARIAASDTMISLVSVGDTTRYWLCDKRGLLEGRSIPPCTEYAHDASFRMRVNVVGSDGSTGAHPLILGGNKADARDPLAAQLVLFDPIAGSYQTVYQGELPRGAFDERFYQHPTETQRWPYPLIKDVVLDRKRNVLWASFVATCPQSGAHACVGADKIDLSSGYPVDVARVWFDSPASYLVDATQPTLAVDTKGNVLMGWLVTGPNIALSHAVGGFSGTLMGENVVQSWRIVSGGRLEPTPHPPFARFDILQITMLPGTDLAVSRGVYGAAGMGSIQLYSSIVAFSATCDWATGRCPWL